MTLKDGQSEKDKAKTLDLQTFFFTFVLDLIEYVVNSFTNHVIKWPNVL